MEWNLKSFANLSLYELYAIMKLRSEIFVVEQNCVYLDPDGKDLDAMHMMGWENNRLVAYTRILPPGTSYEEASIGRVATAIEIRKGGWGRELMKHSIHHAQMMYDNAPIRISAQAHLQDFYVSLGFVAEGETYLEDGIPHVEMLLK